MGSRWGAGGAPPVMPARGRAVRQAEPAVLSGEGVSPEVRQHLCRHAAEPPGTAVVLSRAK